MKVLSYLPRYVLSRVRIFVRPEEHSKYVQNIGHKVKPENIVEVPDDIQHLERKRKFIFEYADEKGYDAVFMFDDDLSLSIWESNIKRFRSIKTNPEVTSDFWQFTIPAMFDRAPAVGIGCKFMAEQKVLKNGLIEMNSKMCCAFGYRVKEVLRVVDWDKTKHLWNLDTMLNLFFLGNGLPILIHYGVTWSALFDETTLDGSKGGCAVYRKMDVINESFLRMLMYFPGLVSRKKKMNIHPQTFLQINWRNAYGHFFRLGSHEPTRLAKAWAEKNNLELPAYCPDYSSKMLAARNAALRLELFLQGKTKDHLKLPLDEALSVSTDKSNPCYRNFSVKVEDLDAYLQETCGCDAKEFMARTAKARPVVPSKKSLF